jgi:hypothetical protein
MKTYATFLSNDGTLIAFEIDNVYVSRRGITKLLRSSGQVTDVKLQGHFGSSNDIRVSFTYFGERFIVWEPYGDSSKYWIGPEEPDRLLADVTHLKKLFDFYRPSFLRCLIGDLLTLRIFSGPK